MANCKCKEKYSKDVVPIKVHVQERAVFQNKFQLPQEIVDGIFLQTDLFTALENKCSTYVLVKVYKQSWDIKSLRIEVDERWNNLSVEQKKTLVQIIDLSGDRLSSENISGRRVKYVDKFERWLKKHFRICKHEWKALCKSVKQTTVRAEEIGATHPFTIFPNYNLVRILSGHGGLTYAPV